MDIRFITAETTLPLRQKVLKPFLQLPECLNPGDQNPDTFHLGVFENSQLVCIGSFEPENHPLFTQAHKGYRLRGMATDISFQGRGYGQQLLLKAFEILRAKQVDFFWCNARIKAIPFYENLGLRTLGDYFEIERIGPHKLMYKWLDQDRNSQP